MGGRWAYEEEEKSVKKREREKERERKTEREEERKVEREIEEGSLLEEEQKMGQQVLSQWGGCLSSGLPGPPPRRRTHTPPQFK